MGTVDPQTGRISVRLLNDPPGRIEVPALPNLFIAIHVGRSVYMSCQRGGQKHRGLHVHGDIDIVPPGTPSIWEPEEQDTALIVSMGSRLLASAAEQAGADASCLEVLNRFQIRDPQIENIGWALKAEMEAGFPGGRVFTDSLATALATCLVRRHSSFQPSPAGSNGGITGHRLRQMLSYIEDNLARALSLREIAAIAGVSPSHCKRIFRQAMGAPVHQYVIQRRVERARALLGEGKLSISQIAHETGFAHQSHLAAHMRRLLGHSPKAIRDLKLR